jgi:hypothetical protein
MEWMMFFFGISMACAILGSIIAVHKDVKEIKERLKD